MLESERIITSRQNPTVKRICALAQKKSRYAEGLLRFDGIKLFGEALASGVRVRTVVLRENPTLQIESAVREAVERGAIDEDSLLLVSDSVFEKISEEASPEGIVTVAEFPSDKHVRIGAEGARKYVVPTGERLLVAESLRDAGNLGTVIRSCAALGIDRLVISDDCADIYNPKTVRAAMGGLFTLKIDILENGTLADAIESLRRSGRRIYSTALHTDAARIGDLELRQGDAFVIGNEGHGLSEKTVKACDACAVIPMREGSESLNAAAAAAICIWETVKAGR